MALTLFEDTFVTIAVADLALADEPDWVALSDAAKEKALRNATSSLDNKNWLGSAKLSTQPLSWPRTAFSYYDPSYNLIIEVEDSTIPRRLEYAVINLALHYIKFPDSYEGFSAEYDRIKLGPLELENTDASNNNTEPPKIPYDTVEKVIKPLISINYATPEGVWWKAN